MSGAAFEDRGRWTTRNAASAPLRALTTEPHQKGKMSNVPWCGDGGQYLSAGATVCLRAGRWACYHDRHDRRNV